MSGMRTNVSSGQIPETVVDSTAQPPVEPGDAKGVSETGGASEILKTLAADGVLGAQSPQEKNTIGALGNLSEPFTPSEGTLDPVTHREVVQQFSAGLTAFGEISMTGDIGSAQKASLVESQGGQISRDEEGIEELCVHMESILEGAASKKPEDIERMNLVSDAVNALPQEVLDSVAEMLGIESLSGDFVNALFKKLQTENEGNDREDQVKMQDVKSKQRTSDIERAKEAQAEAADKAEEAAKKAEEMKSLATMLTIIIVVVAIVVVVATWGAAGPAVVAASGVAAGSIAAGAVGAAANVALAAGVIGTAMAVNGAMNAGCNAAVADAQFEANEADVQSKRHRLDADKSQAMIQEWNEQMQAIMEVIAKMFQGLNKLQTGRHQANQQAVDTLFH